MSAEEKSNEKRRKKEQRAKRRSEFQSQSTESTRTILETELLVNGEGEAGIEYGRATTSKPTRRASGGGTLGYSVPSI